MFTAKQRLAIYKKLLKWIPEQPHGGTYLCWGLSEICEREDLRINYMPGNYDAYPKDEFKTNFPELWAQKPVRIYGSVWFLTDNMTSMDKRINAVKEAIRLVNEQL